MYRKKSRGWYKHKDFILIDLICLFLSLLIAHLIRNGSVQSLFRAGIYRNMISFVILADLFLIIIFESYKGVLRRGHYQELHSVIRQMILLELAMTGIDQMMRFYYHSSASLKEDNIELVCRELRILTHTIEKGMALPIGIPRSLKLRI